MPTLTLRKHIEVLADCFRRFQHEYENAPAYDKEAKWHAKDWEHAANALANALNETKEEESNDLQEQRDRT